MCGGFLSACLSVSNANNKMVCLGFVVGVLLRGFAHLMSMSWSTFLWITSNSVGACSLVACGTSSYYQQNDEPDGYLIRPIR